MVEIYAILECYCLYAAVSWQRGTFYFFICVSSVVDNRTKGLDYKSNGFHQSSTNQERPFLCSRVCNNSISSLHPNLSTTALRHTLHKPHRPTLKESYRSLHLVFLFGHKRGSSHSIPELAVANWFRVRCFLLQTAPTTFRSCVFLWIKVKQGCMPPT